MLASEEIGQQSRHPSSVAASPVASLIGRTAELRELFGLLDRLQERAGVLVLRGEPGIGKTSLLRTAARHADEGGALVLSTVGVQSEADLAFSGLHQLLMPVLDRLERLPAPQRNALSTAFGLSVAGAPEPFLVSLAVLSLLSDTATERSVVCIVDDTQWLDHASSRALAFVARRLSSDPVALVFAIREPKEDFAGLAELVVTGLRDSDAHELLRSVLRGPFDPRVLERIVAETRGNPLALLELPQGRSPGELAGGFGFSGVMPLASRIEESFQRRISSLPGEAQRLLLIAAAEPLGDADVVLRAATRLGAGENTVAQSDTAGLLELGPPMRFRHPLVRSAVYRAAPLSDRRTVHAALAEEIDPEADPERRAWHRALAAGHADEQVAGELELSAERAQQRGGFAAAAAFLERAAWLTVDPRRRAERALSAAHAKHLAGANEAATRLLLIAHAGPLDELGRARVDLLRARMAFAASRGGETPARLLLAAKRLEPLNPRLARDTYLEALSAAMFAGRLGGHAGISEVAGAALAASAAPPPARPSDLLLEGLATRFTAGYAAAAPILKRALVAFRTAAMSSEEELRWIFLACRTAADLWDDEAWEALSARYVNLAYDAGALTALPLALCMRIAVQVLAGQLHTAVSLQDEAQLAAEATETDLLPYGDLFVAAWAGREREARLVIDATLEQVVPHGEALGQAAANWAAAVLCNGLGRNAEALEVAAKACEQPEGMTFFNWSLVELGIAAARTHDLARARGAVEQLSEMARASGTDWGLGIEACTRALISEGAAADDLYHEAIERLGRTRIRVALARAHLLYGEWLRRERRRVEAREQLIVAHDMLGAMGLEAFAARAARELLATGEHARKRSPETREELTAQEAEIARLARDGLSNPEIAGRLYISPRTVEYHLHKVFTKLDICSRNQLGAALPKESVSASRA